MTPNGLAALAASVVAVVGILLVLRASGTWRWIGLVLFVLGIAVAAYAGLEGMGAFCDPAPGAACQ